MQLVFFSQAGSPLFVRDDALSAIWTHEEFRLEAEFPYDSGRAIQRGQRIAFAAPADGSLQAFEVRKVETLEPDHTQRVIAEHIALAELSDEHIAAQEITGKTAAQALTTALSGTLWSVGNVTVSMTSSCDIPMGSIWDALGVIRENWNCYIVPRVVWSASGITGRYIDIIPAQGTWRGVRLSVDSNADEIGVTYDDTDTLTALYGYGRVADDKPLTFAGVTWSTAGGDPANKPSGQTYVEDVAATAAYGRSGRARFGYYQNGDITSPTVLLQKTWEALQATNTPRVTISCRVVDLYRLGYAAQPIRLHDTALVEISPTGAVLTEEIIQLQEDLLDPGNTTPTIGAYIPNIIYIQRQNGKRASGRGGGGGRGQTPKEAEDQYFYTSITANEYAIELTATELGVAKEILRQAGLSINAQGVLVYATDNANMWQSKLNVQADRITSEITRATDAEGTLSSRITQTGEAITAEVTRATAAEGQLSSRITVTAEAVESKVSAGDIASTINQTAQSVLIEASKINLVGYVTASELSATNATISNLVNGVTTASAIHASNVEIYNGLTMGSSAGITVSEGYLTVGGTNVHTAALSMNGVVTNRVMFSGLSTPLDLSHYHVLTIEEGTGASAGQITVTIGTTSGTASDGVANFSIAATQTYINGVAAADTAGYNRAWGVAASSTYSQLPTGSGDSCTAKVPSATVNTATTRTYRLSAGSWDGNTCAVTLRNTFNGAAVCSTTVDASPIFESGWLSAAASSSIDGGASAGWLSVTIPRKNGYENYDTVYYDVSGDTTLDASGKAYARLKNRASGGTVAYADITGLYSAGYAAGQNAGYASGWNAAAGTVDRIEDDTAKTIVFRYPSTYPDSGQSVYYLGASVADSGSVSRYTDKRYSVGLGTTYKYLYFTAAVGGISRVIGVQIRIDASNVTPG